MEESNSLLGDVAQYERTLRVRASAWASDDGDAELTDLLRRISDRRARRSRTTTSVVPSGGPPVAERTEATGDDRSRSESADAGTGGAPAGRILATESYGPTVRVFRIGRPAGFDFRPGQYLRLGVGGGKGRKFSIASAPHDSHLDLAIELRPGGRVTPPLFSLGVGDTVVLGDRAKGGLRLDPQATHHLMVATVTGIAPFRSMVRDALRQSGSARFTVLVGASFAAELPFHEELAALATKEARVAYVPTVSRPGDPANRAWTGATGRVDALATSVASSLDPATTHVYAVGHAGMIANVRRDLRARGFEVTTESYGG